MPYNPKYNEQSYKYRQENLKRVGIDFNKQYYSDVLLPAVKSSGLDVSKYIKEAIKEKMDRDGFQYPEGFLASEENKPDNP